MRTYGPWILRIGHACTCCVWDITGIPCAYVAVILATGKPQWANLYHHVEAYIRIYVGVIFPMETYDDWEEGAKEEAEVGKRGEGPLTRSPSQIRGFPRQLIHRMCRWTQVMEKEVQAQEMLQSMCMVLA